MKGSFVFLIVACNIMSISPNSILITGYTLTGILFLMGLGKKLRNDNIIKISMMISLAVAIIGLFIRSERTAMVSGNATDSFFSPLIFIMSYAALRYLYKNKFGTEPTYNRTSWYDYEEGRHQNWFDVVVHLVPFLLAIVVPLLIK